MVMKQPAIWGIRAGRHGEADNLFLKEGFIAIDWSLGDLTKLAPDREAFKKRYASYFPAESIYKVANAAGQVYRFVHEIKKGDLVVYPSKVDHLVHIGQIAGGYTYTASDGSFAHRRAVKWHMHTPRQQFSQGALFTLELYRPSSL